MKSVISLLSLSLTTPKALGFSICLTQIIPSAELSRVKSALKSVSAKATTTFPVNDSFAQRIACAVPKASSW